VGCAGISAGGLSFLGDAPANAGLPILHEQLTATGDASVAESFSAGREGGWPASTPARDSFGFYDSASSMFPARKWGVGRSQGLLETDLR